MNKKLFEDLNKIDFTTGQFCFNYSCKTWCRYFPHAKSNQPDRSFICYLCQNPEPQHPYENVDV